MGKAEWFVLKERTMLTAEGKAVPAGDPGGVMLLGPAGHRISAAEAEKVGLTKPPRKRRKLLRKGNDT